MQLGDAVAPAIVVCVLFFIAAVIAFGNLVYTHWRFYIVLVISTLCERATQCGAHNASALCMPS